MGLPATYDGNAIFGLANIVDPDENPSRSQDNEFPGVNGKETLFMGTRGTMIPIQCLLVGDTATDLANSIQLIRSYNDGIPRVLTDTLGISYPMAVYRTMKPAGKRIMQDGYTGQHFKEFIVTFESLTG